MFWEQIFLKTYAIDCFLIQFQYENQKTYSQYFVNSSSASLKYSNVSSASMFILSFTSSNESSYQNKSPETYLETYQQYMTGCFAKIG